MTAVARPRGNPNIAAETAVPILSMNRGTEVNRIRRFKPILKAGKTSKAAKSLKAKVPVSRPDDASFSFFIPEIVH
jgi:hypothetical protein